MDGRGPARSIPDCYEGRLTDRQPTGVCLWNRCTVPTIVCMSYWKGSLSAHDGGGGGGTTAGAAAGAGAAAERLSLEPETRLTAGRTNDTREEEIRVASPGGSRQIMVITEGAAGRSQPAEGC